MLSQWSGGALVSTFVFVRGVGTWFCETLKEARQCARRVSRQYPESVATIVWCGQTFGHAINGKEVR